MSPQNQQVVPNTLESMAALLAEVRAAVCIALDQAESRLLEALVAEADTVLDLDVDAEAASA